MSVLSPSFPLCSQQSNTWFSLLVSFGFSVCKMFEEKKRGRRKKIKENWVMKKSERMRTRIKKQDLVVFRVSSRSTFFLISFFSSYSTFLVSFPTSNCTSFHPSFYPVVNACTTLTLIAVPFLLSLRSFPFSNPSFGSSLNPDSLLSLSSSFDFVSTRFALASILDHYFYRGMRELKRNFLLQKNRWIKALRRKGKIVKAGREQNCTKKLFPFVYLPFQFCAKFDKTYLITTNFPYLSMFLLTRILIASMLFFL